MAPPSPSQHGGARCIRVLGNVLSGARENATENARPVNHLRVLNRGMQCGSDETALVAGEVSPRLDAEKMC